MTTLFSLNHQSSSSISEGSSAPPSPASSVHCARSTASLSVSNTASPGINFAHNVPRYGTLIPNRVFVGGISNSTTETDLQERFDVYGTIKEIKIIRDKSGLCKGYGFITFDSDEAARRAQSEPEIIVLKERRLNIAPAVIKQSFNRPYDLTQPGTLVYHHNGTSYAFDNGMAFFSPGPSQSPFSAREAAVFSTPYGPSHSSASGHTFSPVMYPYTPQPVAYMPTGQQFSYQPVSYDPYFKSTNTATSQYLYGPPSAINGSIDSSQSSSPGYGPPAGPGLAGPGPGLHGPGPGNSGPPMPPTAQYYHPGGDMYYNGGTHGPQTTLYQMEGPQTDEYDPRERDTATPVVSLLKLQERGIEEMEITRTPKKTSLGGSGSMTIPAYRSVYSSVQMNQRPSRGRRIINSSGQPSGIPSSGGRGGRGNPCQHRPPGAISGLPGGPCGPGQGRPQHIQRRILTLTRSSTRNSCSGGNTNSQSSPAPTVSPAPSASPAPSTTAPTPSPSASPSPSSPDHKAPIVLADEGSEVKEDSRVAQTHLPPSPPSSPPAIVKAIAADEGEMCQQMQALAM